MAAAAAASKRGAVSQVPSVFSNGFFESALQDSRAEHIPITQMPVTDESLRTVASDVPHDMHPHDRSAIADAVVAMIYAHNGRGTAAPQVGFAYRCFAVSNHERRMKGEREEFGQLFTAAGEASAPHTA